MAAKLVEESGGPVVRQNQSMNQMMAFDEQSFKPIEETEEKTIPEQIFENWSSQQQHGSDGIWSLNDFLRIKAEECFKSYGDGVIREINQIQALIKASSNANDINTVRIAA
eukprot:CAMPEP_0201590842 /NCGR_PEP_ID=MMETSP0190_2-20130828/182372_1 /ASSEMBLY_ACC=CAM_ASM_000263 /TAXON_ID=37353 /ORGANISM="Rosalina sp." /LENGTH=110 /DNA_ID=CAMNT_0048047791 /DNA_START=28 /DNA_END=356 /DNA_ORIENTATION=+